MCTLTKYTWSHDLLSILGELIAFDCRVEEILQAVTRTCFRAAYRKCSWGCKVVSMYYTIAIFQKCRSSKSSPRDGGRGRVPPTPPNAALCLIVLEVQTVHQECQLNSVMPILHRQTAIQPPVTGQERSLGKRYM